MKLFANAILQVLNKKSLRFWRSIELEGFLPFIPLIDLRQPCDNWRMIAKS